MSVIKEVLSQGIAASQATTASELAMLGAAAFYSKDLSLAAKFYSRALELNPNNAIYKKNLQMIQNRS